MNLLLSKVFRLDDFTEGINYVLKKIINKNINSKFVKLHETTKGLILSK